MKRFVVGEARDQSTLFPTLLDDFIAEDNPVRAIEAFVEGLDLKDMGFKSVDPHATGRPAYHPAVLLKLYIYGYLNRIQSSRRLERETQRNVELMWLTERLTPDFKTIADFRKTMAMPSAVYVESSSCFAGDWSCSPKPSWPSMAASSKPSTTVIAISQRPR